MSEEAKKNFDLLWQEVKNNRHTSVLSICSSMISTFPDDLDLKKTQAIALINLGKFEEAYESTQNTPGLEFERAYSLYKLQRFEECLKLTQSRSEKNYLLLRAQTYFKLNQNRLAVAEYEDLIKQDQDSTDLKINLSGSYLAPGLYDQVLSHPLLTSTSDWEQLFNKSCALAELKQYSEALSTLRSCERLLSDSKDQQDELWLVKAQIGYVFQLLQEKEKAIEIYEEILKSKAEPNIKAVSKNNLVVCKNLDSKQGIKLLNEALADENKLTGLQRLGVLENIGLLCYKKRKVSEAYEIIKNCEEVDKNNERLGFFKTFVLYKDKKHEQYKEFLLEKDKPWAYGLLMKLLLEQNKLKDAEEVFEVMSKAKKQALDVNDYFEISGLLEKAGMTQRALETLELACGSYKDKSLWIKWGTLLRKTNNNQKAIQVFETFLSHSTDPVIIANLILSAASSNPELAQKWSSKLPRVNIKSLYNSANAVESLDEIIDKLEFANLTGKIKNEEKMQVELKKKKRKRKPKYPKGFDPKASNNPKPDPERWLPKEERKEFKKKGRKKQIKMKGPQGVVAAEALGQEIGGFNKGPSTAHTQAVGEGKKSRRKRK